MAEAFRWPRDLIIEIYKKSVYGGFRDDILQMFHETYKTLENNHYRSCVILAGETLFRVNCEFVLWYTKYHGTFEYGVERKKIKLRAHEISGNFKAAESLLNSLDISSSISALENLSLINREIFLDMHALRFLRNRMVHSSRPPRLDNYDEPITSPEQIDEVFNTPLENGLLPRKWRQHQFEISINGKKTKYVVNQERLDIDIAKGNHGHEYPFTSFGYPIIAFGLLTHCMKCIYSHIPPTSHM